MNNQTSQPTADFINLRCLTLFDIMLPDGKIKSGLSSSYLKAVANIAGYKIQFQNEDDFGVDAIITELQKRDTGRIWETGVNLWIQLKATTMGNCRTTDTEIIYDLANKNYNDLTYADSVSPKILVLFVMPNEREDWLTHSIEMMILKKCAHWTYLSGKPRKDNEDSTTAIHIDKNKTFSPTSLKEIMDKISIRGDLYELL